VPGLRAFEVVQHADFALDVTLDMAPGIGEQACSSVRRGLESILGTTAVIRMRTGSVQRDLADTKFRPIRSLVGRPA
jgi:hypothetical protein